MIELLHRVYLNSTRSLEVAFLSFSSQKFINSDNEEKKLLKSGSSIIYLKTKEQYVISIVITCTHIIKKIKIKV